MREAATRRIDLMTDDMTQVPELDIPATTEEHLTQLANVSTTDKFPCEEEKPLPEPEESMPEPEESMPEERTFVEQKQMPSISPPAAKVPKLSEAATAAVSYIADKEQKKPLEKEKPVMAAQPSAKTGRGEETAKAREKKLSAKKDESMAKTGEPAKNKVEEPAKNEVQDPANNEVQEPAKNGEAAKKEELEVKTEQPTAKKEDVSSIKNAPPTEVYNGAKTDKYSWSQTMTDLDIVVVVPESITAKDVKVDIKNDHLKVTVVRPVEEVRTLPHPHASLATSRLMMVKVGGSGIF